MRELHVVALSEDGRSVLLATSKGAQSGGFRLALDGKLTAAMRGELPRPGEKTARDSDLTPKEIQSRLRAGESPEQIAASAGVAVARVERFAGPVLSERERIIEEARAAFVSRTRRGPSLLPLGDAVDAALAETSGLRPESVGWTARRLESGHWLVQVSYVARARTRTSSWVYEPQTRSATPSDAASAALGHAGEEPTPRRRPAPVRQPTASKRTPVKRAPVKRAAPKRAAGKKTGASKAAASRAAATKVAASKVAASKVATARKPVASKKAPVRPAGPALRVVPPPPAEARPMPARPKRPAGERAQVPAWDDVLFGPAPKGDRTGG